VEVLLRHLPIVLLVKFLLNKLATHFHHPFIRRSQKSEDQQVQVQSLELVVFQTLLSLLLTVTPQILWVNNVKHGIML
jgi:hypothetical protein